MNESKLSLIDVTPNDFLKLHGGLVRMLQALEEAGPSGLPTNTAGLQVFGSRTYGWRVLNRAQQLGYITREKIVTHIDNGRGGGHYYIANRLTDRGRRLLQELR